MKKAKRKPCFICGVDWETNTLLPDGKYICSLCKCYKDAEDDCVNEFMRFLKGHRMVKDVHFYRGDGEREIIIKLI